MSDATTCPLCKLPLSESGCVLTPDDPRGPYRCRTALGPPGTPEMMKAMTEALAAVPMAKLAALMDGLLAIPPETAERVMWAALQSRPEPPGGSYILWSELPPGNLPPVVSALWPAVPPKPEKP